MKKEEIPAPPLQKGRLSIKNKFNFALWLFYIFAFCFSAFYLISNKINSEILMLGVMIVSALSMYEFSKEWSFERK